MTLIELERKLADSCDELRNENQNLIALLKSRQDQLKDTVEAQLNFESNFRVRNTDSYPRVHHGITSTNAEMVLNKTEKSHQRARKMLSQCARQDALYSTEVRFNDNLTKHHDWQSIPQVDLSAEDEGDIRETSTPDLTPIKSILKRRKIINDNVCVNSKFQYTPSINHTSSEKDDLNFSYSDEDEVNYYPRQPLGGSYTDLNLFHDQKSMEESVSKYLEQSQNQKKLGKHIKDIEHKMEQRLLDDPGNDRQYANIVKNIDQRPKNSLFDITEKEPIAKSFQHSKTLKKHSVTESLNMNPSRENRPLLGYDWIAGVLENEGLFEQTESLFSEIEQFRRTNREECVGSASVWDKSLNLSRPISPEIDDPGHTCIHSYSVNDRLFTESINLNEEQKSVCPVCLVSRKPPTREDPAFVRVSVPRSSVSAPYKIKPHTRKSFDPTDSYALSKHCLAGWQNAKPCTLPTASTLDIKNKVITKETTTYDEARKIAESFSRMGRLLDGKDLPEDKLSKELLNRTHCLRYELEVMKDGLRHNKGQ